MPGRYYDVDEEGNIIDPRLMDLSPGEVRPYDRYNDTTNDNGYNRYDRPISRTPSRSRSRHYSPLRHRESNRRPWEVPMNPLLRAEESDDEAQESHSSRHHHRHHHRHHRSERHRHRSRSTSKPRLREFSTKKNTPADLKDRWGHELYIENVVLNPDPEPPRIISNYEPPKEKWISKAGGVAIFTSRPTSASSYQGKYDM